jgi:hypothetical protein
MTIHSSTKGDAVRELTSLSLVAALLASVTVSCVQESPSSRSHGTGGHHVLAKEGPENWKIGGQWYRISSSYYLRLPVGLQFTLEYPHKFDSAAAPMNDERALEIVFPLMRHAYEKGLYKRSSISKLGEGQLEPTRIGVVLWEGQGKVVRGYRVGLSLDQVKERIRKLGDG